jgi:hypothetical protein
LLATTSGVFVEAWSFFSSNKFLTFTTNWHGVNGAPSFEVWNQFKTSWVRWAFVNVATAISRDFFDNSFSVSTRWFFHALIPDVVTSNFARFRAATWLTDIVFVIKKIAWVVFDTFVLASITTGASVSNTSTSINGFS